MLWNWLKRICFPQQPHQTQDTASILQTRNSTKKIQRKYILNLSLLLLRYFPEQERTPVVRSWLCEPTIYELVIDGGKLLPPYVNIQ